MNPFPATEDPLDVLLHGGPEDLKPPSPYSVPEDFQLEPTCEACRKAGAGRACAGGTYSSKTAQQTGSERPPMRAAGQLALHCVPDVQEQKGPPADSARHGQSSTSGSTGQAQQGGTEAPAEALDAQ